MLITGGKLVVVKQCTNVKHLVQYSGILNELKEGVDSF